MHLAIELPEDIARRLAAGWEDLPRRALEALAVDGYRSRLLTRGEVQRMLDLSWHETERFLVEHGAELNYTEEDLEEDRQTLERLPR
ncbi:MAG: UPF0175 family protein [Thermoanaerobaculia bacterium]